ncbi:MAG: hypothetical protein WBY88_11330 [Desulfosarcina sp.]
MQTIIGTSNRVQEADLTDATFNVSTIDAEIRRKYLGAKDCGVRSPESGWA